MAQIPGYELKQQLHQGRRTAVYRGWRSADDLPVIVKVVSESGTAEDSAQLRYEHEILQTLDIDGVPSVIALVTHEGQVGLVCRDIGGTSVDANHEGSEWLPSDVIRVGCATARILGRLHQHQVVHGDLQPSHVVTASSPDVVQLVGFGQASTLSSEAAESSQSRRLSSAPVFTSPEGTGRTNHSVDHRADLYSLGATLFFLFTGEPPFVDDESLESGVCARRAASSSGARGKRHRAG